MEASSLRKQRSVPEANVFHCRCCEDIALRPKECLECGSLFCESCIQPRKAPHSCSKDCKASDIKELSMGLKRIYNDIDIKCKYYSLCNKVVKISDLEAHEDDCQAPPCKSKYVCGNNITRGKKFGTQHCSKECYVLEVIKATESPVQLHTQLAKVFPFRAREISLVWDPVFKASFITATGDRIKTQNAPLSSFASAVTETGFKSGEHYWEVLDIANESLMKVGITTTKHFDYNSAFSDFPTGYAFYALGQLRNGSDSKGQGYAMKAESKRPIGVYLNMDKGVLGFVVNGCYQGIAFASEQLKKGEVFPAVSFLKAVDCTITSLSVPQVIKKTIV